MSIKNSLSVLLLFFLCYNGVNAQNDWRPGFIITNAGDSVSGLADYRDNRSNTLNCYFRTSEDAETRIYSPSEITGFGYDEGKLYLSIPLEKDGTKQRFFVEALFRGKVNLYYYITEESHYLIEKDGELYELKNTAREYHRNDKHYVQEDEEYKRTLNFLLHDGGVEKEIKNSHLDQKSLIKLVRKYQEQVEPDRNDDALFEKKIKAVHVDVGIVFGFNGKTLHLDRNSTYSMEGGTTQFGGFALNVNNLPMIFERFSLQLEVIANSYKLENEKKYSLNIPIFADYKILTAVSKRFYPKIEAGVSSYFISDETFKTRHLTPAVGLSLHYEYLGDNSVFLRGRFERSPQVFRFGAGLLF